MSQSMKVKGLWQHISWKHQESHLFVAHVFCRSSGFFLRVRGKLESSKNLSMSLNSLCNRKQTDIDYLKKHRTRFQLTRYCIRNCLASAKNCLLPFTVKQTEKNLFKLLRSIHCQTQCLTSSMPVWWANRNITYN